MFGALPHSLIHLLLQELLTRHKSTVADFLSKNDDRFFADYNSKLLVSTNYITRRQALKVMIILSPLSAL
ncbi:hypothetical protein SASPL_152050 [Salvia splendens]|uniref:Uncharacterized protein n=1 Tax=Salvia splendens TaxID=180675 RepID=A0A8X8W2K1_SALSN|nr:hypothetical protein SASPL_152050 [Salvia splendens]